MTGIDVEGGRVTGVQTSRGPIRAEKVALAAAGHSSVLAAMAGLRLPVQSHPLQALVSELFEQVLPCVVMSNAVHVYVSQAHKGELVMGAGIDAVQRLRAARLHPRDRGADGGGARALPDLRPGARAADLGRDRRHDARTPRRSSGARRSTGSTSTAAGAPAASRARPGSGWTYAHTIAHDEPHALNAPFALERFESGALIDEHGAAAVAH